MTKTKKKFVPRSLYLPEAVDRRLVGSAKADGDYISQHARKALEKGLDLIERGRKEAETALAK